MKLTFARLSVFVFVSVLRLLPGRSGGEGEEEEGVLHGGLAPAGNCILYMLSSHEHNNNYQQIGTNCSPCSPNGFIYSIIGPCERAGKLRRLRNELALCFRVDARETFRPATRSLLKHALGRRARGRQRRRASGVPRTDRAVRYLQNPGRSTQNPRDEPQVSILSRSPFRFVPRLLNTSSSSSSSYCI